MTKEQKNKVAKVEENLPAAPLNAAALFDMQGMGLENMESSDTVFPFINIIQSGSPQRKKGKEGYIEGAEEGMMYNTTTKELYDQNEGLKLVPIYHEKRLIERTAKTEKEAPKFVADHKQDKSVLEGLTKGQWEYTTAEGNTITSTDYMYFLIIKKDGSTEFASISFKSTLAKSAREILSQARLRGVTLPNGVKFTPPLFFRSYTFKTVMKSGNGNDWHVYSVTPSDDLVKFDDKGNIIDNIAGGAAIFQEAFTLNSEIFKAGAHVVDSSQEAGDASAPKDAF